MILVISGESFNYMHHSIHENTTIKIKLRSIGWCIVFMFKYLIFVHRYFIERVFKKQTNTKKLEWAYQTKFKQKSWYFHGGNRHYPKQYLTLNVMVLNFFFFFKAISSNCSETIIYSVHFFTLYFRNQNSI